MKFAFHRLIIPLILIFYVSSAVGQEEEIAALEIMKKLEIDIELNQDATMDFNLVNGAKLISRIQKKLNFLDSKRGVNRFNGADVGGNNGARKVSLLFFDADRAPSSKWSELENYFYRRAFHSIGKIISRYKSTENSKIFNKICHDLEIRGRIFTIITVSDTEDKEIVGRNRNIMLCVGATLASFAQCRHQDNGVWVCSAESEFWQKHGVYVRYKIRSGSIIFWPVAYFSISRYLENSAERISEK